MTTYPVLGANNQIQNLPLQTWGDSCYVLFGMAERDLINSIDQEIATVVRPAFQQKQHDSLEDDKPFAEALLDLDVLLDPERRAAGEFFDSIRAGKFRYDYQWDEWSQLLDPQFLLQVLAYAIHSVALKVWDLIDGINRKADNIFNYHRECFQYAEERLKLRQNNLFSSASVSLFEYIGEQARGLKITFSNDHQRPIHVEVQRLYTNPESGNQGLFAEAELPRLSSVGHPALEVTFDLDDLRDQVQDFQCRVAVDLMNNEQATKIFIRTRAVTDLSVFGFVKMEDCHVNNGHTEFDDFQFWIMYNPNLDSAQQQERHLLAQVNGGLFPPDKMIFARKPQEPVPVEMGEIGQPHHDPFGSLFKKPEAVEAD